MEPTARTKTEIKNLTLKDMRTYKEALLGEKKEENRPYVKRASKDFNRSLCAEDPIRISIVEEGENEDQDQTARTEARSGSFLQELALAVGHG
ncbi:hypothetical protein V6N13_030071 [Hibiscus sabdariffa]